MSTWDDYKKTCVHGITEDLDFHSCEKCQEIAKQGGLKVIPRKETYIFTSQKQITTFLKKNVSKKVKDE